MNFSDIVENIKVDIKSNEVYSRSLLLGVNKFDIYLDLIGTQYESLGLYNIKGKYNTIKDELINLAIECDFGFLYYLDKKYKVRVNVISNKIPLNDKIYISDKIKFYDGLDLSLYDSKLICRRLDFLLFFLEHNANSVYLVDDTPFDFFLYKIDEVNNLRSLYYYLNNTICSNKCICFNIFVQTDMFIKLNLKQIKSLSDVEANIVMCLQYYIPKILNLHITQNIRIEFHFMFGYYAYQGSLRPVLLDDTLNILSTISPLFSPLFSTITDVPINLTIDSFDKDYTSIKGSIYPSGNRVKR